MKIAPKQTPETDPRSEPLPLFVRADGLAEQIRFAGNSQDAWRLLGFAGERGDMDQDVMDRLSAAATALCTIGDAIGKGLVAFGARDPEEPIPASWVDRMVELHGALLEGYWRLDELAWLGVREGGWTVTTKEALADDPAGRVAQRARWVAEENKPREPALWFDRLGGALDAAVGFGTLDEARDAGRALVAEATRRRFARWHETRRET